MSGDLDTVRVCNALTVRGTRCKVPYDQCTYHPHALREFSEWYHLKGQQKFYDESGAEICGAPITGHSSRRNGRCTKQLRPGRRACLYHRFKPSSQVASISFSEAVDILAKLKTHKTLKTA